MLLVSRDPNFEVRRAVVSCIAPSIKTLPCLCERTRDVNYNVRHMAYTVLGEKVHIKALSIAQRIQLLQDGLNDRTGKEIYYCVKFIWMCMINTEILTIGFA